MSERGISKTWGVRVNALGNLATAVAAVASMIGDSPIDNTAAKPSAGRSRSFAKSTVDNFGTNPLDVLIVSILSHCAGAGVETPATTDLIFAGLEAAHPNRWKKGSIRGRLRSITRKGWLELGVKSSRQQTYLLTVKFNEHAGAALVVVTDAMRAAMWPVAEIHVPVVVEPAEEVHLAEVGPAEEVNLAEVGPAAVVSEVSPALAVRTVTSLLRVPVRGLRRIAEGLGVDKDNVLNKRNLARAIHDHQVGLAA